MSIGQAVTPLMSGHHQTAAGNASLREPKLVRVPTFGRPEIQLILACARTSIDDEGADRIRRLLKNDLDWLYISKKAQQHGVMPLLYRSLSCCQKDAVPEGVLSRLQGSFHDNIRFNLFRTRELLKLLRLCELRGIPALSFKGPLLAAQAFAHPGLRQYVDLDVLVHKEDVPEVQNLLLSAGYRLAFPITRIGRVIAAFAPGKDLIFVKGRVVIELHWRLTDRYFDFPLDMKGLWRRLVPMSLAGSTVRSLPLEDLILYLCLHGTRHSWERLAWICDVAELIRVNPEIDWDSLMNRASTLGNERSLALGLFLASDLLGASLPEDVSARIQIDPKVRLVAARVRELLFQQENKGLDISYWYRHHLLMRERFRDRVRIYIHYGRRYFRLTVTPNTRDYALLPLPGSLSFLYYMLRPVRLVREYGGPTCQRLMRRILRQKES